MLLSGLFKLTRGPRVGMGGGGEQEVTPRFAAIMMTIISRGLIELDRKKGKKLFP